MNDPSFVAASDQMKSATRDIGMLTAAIIEELRKGGLTRRQARRVAEAWATKTLMGPADSGSDA